MGMPLSKPAAMPVRRISGPLVSMMIAIFSETRRTFSTIVAALRANGIEATVGARKELLAAGYKISGTASHVTRTSQLFHGTLLHRTDLERLDYTLRGDRSLRGKSVASVPSPVTNIASITGTEETTETFLSRLTDFLSAYYDCDPIRPVPSQIVEKVRRIAQEKYG